MLARPVGDLFLRAIRCARSRPYCRGFGVAQNRTRQRSRERIRPRGVAGQHLSAAIVIAARHLHPPLPLNRQVRFGCIAAGKARENAAAKRLPQFEDMQRGLRQQEHRRAIHLRPRDNQMLHMIGNALAQQNGSRRMVHASPTPKQRRSRTIPKSLRQVGSAGLNRARQAPDFVARR